MYSFLPGIDFVRAYLFRVLFLKRYRGAAADGGSWQSALAVLGFAIAFKCGSGFVVLPLLLICMAMATVTGELSDKTTMPMMNVLAGTFWLRLSLPIAGELKRNYEDEMHALPDRLGGAVHKGERLQN